MEHKKNNLEDEKIKKISITKRAEQILKEKVNGSKGKIDEFMKKIVNEGISKGNFEIFLEGGNNDFHYHKCKDMYVIFIFKKNEIMVVDFLTEIDFDNLKYG